MPTDEWIDITRVGDTERTLLNVDTGERRREPLDMRHLIRRPTDRKE